MAKNKTQTKTEPTLRKPEEIQRDYGQACAELGELTYKLEREIPEAIEETQNRIDEYMAEMKAGAERARARNQRELAEKKRTEMAALKAKAEQEVKDAKINPADLVPTPAPVPTQEQINNLMNTSPDIAAKHSGEANGAGGVAAPVPSSPTPPADAGVTTPEVL
jgi:hypothetical protein